MLFDNTMPTTKNAFSLQSLQNQNNSDVNRLSTELMTKNSQIVKLTNRIDETARKVIFFLIKKKNKSTREAIVTAYF